ELATGHHGRATAVMAGAAMAASVGGDATQGQRRRDGTDAEQVLDLEGFHQRSPGRRVAHALRARAFLAQALLLVGFVLVEVAVEEEPLRVAFAGEDVGADAVQEPAVMADDHGRAGELQQRFFQRAQRFDVQVVGRFVQHQHVAALGQRLGQVQAAAFAAGQRADQLLLVVALEVEAAQIGAAGHDELADRDVVQAAGHVLPDGLVGFQAGAALVDKGQLGGLADLDRAAVRLLHALQHAEQRRLAGAVGADDADDGAGRHLEAQVVDQHAVAEALADVLELDDLIAQALGHGDEDLVRHVALLVLDVAQLLEAGQARLALGLAALGIGANPLQLLLHRLHARVFGLLLLLQAAFLLVQPLGVVALPRDAVSAVQFQDPLGGVVEEVAIMGDGHHGAREALQELLQPL
ncbi:hypothetical protein BVRB_018280, partial [Beta vulgaris subsp. vulgaris]